nr:MAG TPA: hypothetical protein [Caudoviricetes sp.]DAT34344.1 MAG TPA: hypothetical protein [Caudoviricetes sp.]
MLIPWKFLVRIENLADDISFYNRNIYFHY